MNNRIIGIVDILLALWDILMVVIDIQTGQYVFAVVLGIMAAILLPLGIFFLVKKN